LQVEPDELDPDRFERLVAQAYQAIAAHDLDVATGTLRQALGLGSSTTLLVRPGAMPGLWHAQEPVPTVCQRFASPIRTL
jgi:hypothetical protein